MASSRCVLNALGAVFSAYEWNKLKESWLGFQEEGQDSAGSSYMLSNRKEPINMRGK